MPLTRSCPPSKRNASRLPEQTAGELTSCCRPLTRAGSTRGAPPPPEQGGLGLESAPLQPPRGSASRLGLSRVPRPELCIKLGASGSHLSAWCYACFRQVPLQPSVVVKCMYPQRCSNVSSDQDTPAPGPLPAGLSPWSPGPSHRGVTLFRSQASPHRCLPVGRPAAMPQRCSP